MKYRIITIKQDSTGLSLHLGATVEQVRLKSYTLNAINLDGKSFVACPNFKFTETPKAVIEQELEGVQAPKRVKGKLKEKLQKEFDARNNQIHFATLSTTKSGKPKLMPCKDGEAQGIIVVCLLEGGHNGGVVYAGATKKQILTRNRTQAILKLEPKESIEVRLTGSMYGKARVYELEATDDGHLNINVRSNHWGGQFELYETTFDLCQNKTQIQNPLNNEA